MYHEDNLVVLIVIRFEDSIFYLSFNLKTFVNIKIFFHEKKKKIFDH